VIFHLLVDDLSTSAIAMASMCPLEAAERARIQRLIVVPKTPGADWDWVLNRAKSFGM
jgi:hypothetical protein